MATGRERLKVSRHTKLWMGSINLRFLCRNLSLQKDGDKRKKKRKESVNILCESVPEDDCGLFLDVGKSIMFGFQGSYFLQLVGGRICQDLWGKVQFEVH